MQAMSPDGEENSGHKRGPQAGDGSDEAITWTISEGPPRYQEVPWAQRRARILAQSEPESQKRHLESIS